MSVVIGPDVSVELKVDGVFPGYLRSQRRKRQRNSSQDESILRLVWVSFAKLLPWIFGLRRATKAFGSDV